MRPSVCVCVTRQLTEEAVPAVGGLYKFLWNCADGSPVIHVVRRLASVGNLLSKEQIESVEAS